MPSQRDTCLRHAKHYHSVLQQAMALYEKGGHAIAASFELVDHNWLNIQHGFGWCTDNSSSNILAAELCSAFPLAALKILRERQRPRERITWHEQAFAAAQRLNSATAMAAHFDNLFVAYSDVGEVDQAIHYAERILEVARVVADTKIEMHALGNLGIVCSMASQPDKALLYHHEQLKLAQSEGNRYEELRSIGGLGHAYKKLNDITIALTHLHQALNLARNLKNRLLESSTLCDIGLIYAESGKRNRAMWYYVRARLIARSLHHQSLIASINWNMGLLYARKGALGRAVELMNPLVHYEQRIDHTHAQVSTDRLLQIKQLHDQQPVEAWLSRFLSRIKGGEKPQ
jgi:tetratricopeptide (TPR) repeat protein